MPRLFITSLLLIVAALFSPLLFLSRAEEVAPAREAEPTPIVLPEPEADGDYEFTVLGETGVSKLSMADYLPGAVAAEMPAVFDPEALKAQAVALRTYILRMGMRENPKHSEASICTNSACCAAWLPESALQARWGDDFEENILKITAAVRATDGQYLSYGGEPIQAVFHASSEGHTESSGSIWSPAPYLISVDSPETPETVESLVTERSLTADELRTAVAAAYPAAVFPSDPALWLGSLERTDTGRVKSLALGGAHITGNEARSLLQLRSTDFDVKYEGGQFVFTVRGYGHGVGMSQQGANLLAAQGLGYAEILSHYYPGTSLVR